SSAQACCEAALKIREKLNFVRDQGMSHNTLSILYREQGAYEKALQHSNAALTIFSDRNDVEWQGKAYRERGVLRWLIGQTDAAQNDLRRSLNIFEKYGFQHELPNSYFRYALLLWTQSTRAQDITLPERRMLLEKAEDYLKKCHEFGIKIADSFHILMSLMQLTELLYFATSKNYGNRSHDIKGHYSLLRHWTKTNHSQYPLALGHAEKIMGAIELDAGRYTQALRYFKNSYARIALAGTQRQYLLDKDTIDFLGSNIAKLKPITAVRWCNVLIQTWQQKNLTGRYPEFITHLKIWRIQAKLNRGNT
ncbi:tetratricopeptide repeat protein, partial [bacterium]|nr:tetratricopeptide repeat protein [bacterium]